MTYPLPVWKHDPAFRALCQRKQLQYIAAERWRMHRAETFPAYTLGQDLTALERAAWDALSLHPQSPAVIQARLAELDRMESECLTDLAWLDWTCDLAEMIGNTPALA